MCSELSDQCVGDIFSDDVGIAGGVLVHNDLKGNYLVEIKNVKGV